MTHGFLSVDASSPAIARSPMEGHAIRAGANVTERGGWRVATDFGDSAREARTCRRSVGWADVSHVPKLELQGSAEEIEAFTPSFGEKTPGPPGSALHAMGAWWCPVTPERLLLIGADTTPGSSVPASVPDRGSLRSADVTTVHAGLLIAGPRAEGMLERLCRLDLRPKTAPVGSFRPGAIGRVSGHVLREADDRFLLLFGWSLGEYIWTLVADAGSRLEGAPVGLDSLPARSSLSPSERSDLDTGVPG